VLKTAYSCFICEPYWLSPNSPMLFLQFAFNITVPSALRSSKWFLYFSSFDTSLVRISILSHSSIVISQSSDPLLVRLITISEFLLTPWSRVLLEKLTGL
jgi:hypothetical protein